MKILVYGDSNVWGYIPGSVDLKTSLGRRFDENTRWTGLLQKNLGKGFYIVEEGLNGRTTFLNDNLANKPYRNGLAALPMVLETHYPLDLVVFFVGTNDQKIQFNQSVEETAKGMRLLTDVVINSNKGAKSKAPEVLIIVPPPISGSALSDYFDTNSIQKSKELSKSYKKIADDLGCLYLNSGDIVQASSIDGIHLNEHGHSVLAKILAEKILRLSSGNINKSNIVIQPFNPATRTETLTILHSNLFTAVNLRTPRKFFDREKIYILNKVESNIKYTGTELRVLHDEDVWLNIIHFARKQKIHNCNFTITIKTSEFIREMGWGNCGSDYQNLKSSLKRLSSALIEVSNVDGYRMKSYSLVRKYIMANKCHSSGLFILLEPDIYDLYCSSNVGTMCFDLRQTLSSFDRKIYSLLVGYSGSMHLSELEKISGVKYSKPRQFKARLKKTLEGFIKEKILSSYVIGKDHMLSVELEIKI